MARGYRLVLVLWLWNIATVLQGQSILVGEPPRPFKPLHPPTKEEDQRREAKRLYGIGLLHQRQDKLLEALSNFEDARKLDPTSAPIQRALVPIYLALGRDADALEACRLAVKYDPDSGETWFVLARQLRERGDAKEAIEALQNGAKAKSTQDNVQLLLQMQYDVGVLYEESKNYAKAAAAFAEVVKTLVDRKTELTDSGHLGPNQIIDETARTYERIGKVCIQAKQFDKAVEAFKQAQKISPKLFGRLNRNLAEVLLAQGKPAEALPYCYAYLKNQPPGDQGYRMFAEIMGKLGRDKQVLPALQKYAARDSFNAPLQMLLAEEFGRQQRYLEAEQVYNKLAEGSPTPEIYKGLFNLYKAQQKADKLLGLLDRTLEAAVAKDDRPADRSAARRARAMLAVLKDDGGLVKAMLPQVQRDLVLGRKRSPDTWRFLALLISRTGQLDTAEQLYRACLKHLTPRTEADIYSGLLDVLSDAGKHEEVVAVAKQGLKTAQATNRVIFFLKIATSMAMLDRFDDALAAADEVVKLANDQNRLRLRRFRVEVLRQCERYDQATAECLALLKEFSLPGEIRDIRHSLSNIYISAKEMEKAEEQLEMILEMDPSDAGANNDLGYILADQGKKLKEAEVMIRKAIDLDRQEKKRVALVRANAWEDNAAYLDSLGWVLFRKGEYKEARDWLEKASSLPMGAEDPVLWDHLGDVYIRLNQSDKAHECWQKAAHLYDTSKRRRKDDRYREVLHKIKLLKSEVESR